MGTDIWQGKAREFTCIPKEGYGSLTGPENEDEVCIDIYSADGWTYSTVDYSKWFGMPDPSDQFVIPESRLPPVPDHDKDESRPDEATVPTAPPGSHPAVDVNIHGKTLSGLVDTCAGVGIIASSIVRDLGLKTIPIKEYINGFDDAAPRTLAKEKITAPLEYDGKTYWETLYVVENPFHSLILPCAMLLKSGLVQFAKPVRYIIKKLKGVLPLAACKFKRSPRSIRTWFTGQPRQSPSEEEKRKEEERKEKKRKRRELESNEEQRQQEEADELLDRMSDGAPKHQFRLKETNRRRAWQDSFDAGG